MTLYELNQAGYNSLPKMSKSAIDAKRLELIDWFEGFLNEVGDTDDAIYFMLLNNERHYYTIFAWMEDSANVLAKEVLSIVQDLGTLKSIEKNDNGAWEFWVTLPDATTHAYLLFNYTQGVIEL